MNPRDCRTPEEFDQRLAEELAAIKYEYRQNRLIYSIVPELIKALE